MSTRFIQRVLVQSTRTLLCLGAWSKQSLVKVVDVMEALKLPNVNGSEGGLNNDWDDIL